MAINYIYFIYGLCVMFYGMMAWLFLRKNREMLSRLVAVLMIVLCVQCVKDLFFISPETTSDSALWMIMTSMDMIVIPLYAFILIELCHPTTPPPSIRMIASHELPFVLLPILFVITHNSVFYFANVAWAMVYGIGYAIWTVINIPRYHRLLKERFSYDDNINLNWLRYILMSFFAILLLWIVDCLIINLKIEAMYMLGSLVVWMFICYFLYKHESVIDELSEPAIITESTAISDNGTSMLKERIFDLFENQRIYLNPQLRLSHVAAMANTNRTYVSRFFNDSHGKTFFEFVNEYRVKYAISLLKASNEKLDAIAEQSGFSSRQSFHRVFSKIAGCTPEQYRKAKND